MTRAGTFIFANLFCLSMHVQCKTVEENTQALFNTILNQYTVSETKADAVLSSIAEKYSVNWTSTTESRDIDDLARLIDALDKALKNASGSIRQYVSSGDFIAQPASYRLRKTIDNMYSFFDNRLNAYAEKRDKRTARNKIIKAENQLDVLSDKLHYDKNSTN